MFGFLRELTCKHEFERIKDISFKETESDKLPYKFVMVYMCKKCGKVKKIVVS